MQRNMTRPVTDYEAGPFQSLADTELGRKLWEFLKRDDIVSRLDTATDLGNPAVAGIEEQLLAEFREQVLDDRMKQMIGHMVRQVMEAEGYEIEKQNVTISSAVFAKGTRYRQPDWQRLHVFRSSKNPRALCFAASRDAEKLPPPEAGGQWRFWASFATILRGHIAYGIDVREVRKEVANKGFALRPLKRMLRAS
jgi:hypothetical protein